MRHSDMHNGIDLIQRSSLYDPLFRARSYPANQERTCSVEDIAFGITREWLFEKRIVVYSVTLMNITTIRIWSNEVLSSLENWSKARPYLALHDLSQPGIGLSYMVLARAYLLNPAITPQGSAQLQHILSEYPDFRVCLAVVLSKEYADLFPPEKVKPLTAHDPRINTALFFERSEALNWLKKVGIPVEQ